MLAATHHLAQRLASQAKAETLPDPAAADAPVATIAQLVLAFAQALELEAGWVRHIITTQTLISLALRFGLHESAAGTAIAQLSAAKLLTPYRGRYLLCDAAALRRVALDGQA